VQGGKAVVRPELFVRLRSKWGRRAYVPGSVLPFETRAAQHLPPPLDEIPQPQGSIQIPLSDGKPKSGLKSGQLAFQKARA
jgi:hypothetical protein